MANRFFQPGVQRSAKVDDLFARIASRYDLLNDLQSLGLHRHWKRLVVNLVQPHSNSLALDLCCGTGDIAWSLAKRSATVMALDFSDRMLQVARQRSAGMLGRNIEGSAL